MVIGEKIKKVREELGISQRQLAGEDITRAYISLIENGHATPSEKILRIIANRLQKPMSFFWGEEDIEFIEISDALLERAKKNAEEGKTESALKIAYKIFEITYDSQIIVATHLFILELKMNEGLYEEALEYGEDALADFRELKDRVALVEYYLLMGKASFRLENYIDAKKSYKWAIKYSEHLKILHEQKIQAYVFLGTTNIRLGNIKEAIENYKHAKNEASLTGDSQLQGEIMLGLGKAYFLQDEYTASLKCTDKAIILLNQFELDRTYALHNRAVIVRYLGDAFESTKVLRECLDLYKKLGLLQKQASIFEELAIISLENGDIQASKEYCNQGLKLLEIEDEGIIRAKLYRILGLICKEELNFDHSYYFLRMSYDLLLRLNAKSEAQESLRFINNLKEENIEKVQ